MANISLLIVVKSGKYLESLINSIKKLHYPKKKLQVIFFNNYCDAHTSELLKKLTKKNNYMQVIYSKMNLNIPEARNFLLKYANGKIIVFTDHDVTLEKEWLNKIEKLINKGYDIVGGRMDSKQKKLLPKTENTRKQIWYDYVKKNNIAHFETVSMAFKREVLNKIKFNEKAKFAEDLDFTTKAEKKGFKLKFDTDIYVYHNHKTKILQYLSTFFKYGESHALVDKNDGVVKKIKKFKIFYYLIFPLLLIFTFLLWKFYSFLLFTTLLIHKYSFPAIKKSIKELSLFPLIVLILEPLRFMAWTYGFVKGVIKNG